MRMWNHKVLIMGCGLAFFFSCQKDKFHGSANAKGNSVPENTPLDLTEEHKKDHPEADPKSPKHDPNSDPSKKLENGPRPGEGTEPSAKQTFRIPCNAAPNTVQDFKAPVAQKITAVVQGEICPESTDALHIMMIVDVSGSMGPHYDEDIGGDSPGHDPVKGGTCGRLEAARKLVSHMIAERDKAAGGGKHVIQVSVVPFASEAVERMVIPPTEISSFQKSYLDRQHFCRYVAQDGYGNLGESILFPGVEPSTNYAAAFARAQQALAAAADKVHNTAVYFISDGEPTTPGSKEEALQAGVKAGKAMRDDPRLKNTVINGLYLGIPGTPTYEAAASVLTQVTGSSRVLPAENADQLAEKITAFPKASINLDASKYAEMARLAVDPYADKALGIRYLKEIRDGVWEYETQPFILLGKKGEATDNVVSINIFGEDGFLFKSALTIRYTQQ